MKLTGNAAPTTATKNDNIKDCVCTIVTLLRDLSEELKLDDAALKIYVNTDAVDVSSASTASIYNSVQQHISKLQAVKENLMALVGAENKPSSVDHNTPNNAVVQASHGEKVTGQTRYHPPAACRSTSEADESEPQADDLTVQIRAGKSEIDRRISAFMERKQMEINENNVREFCNVIDCNQEDSCARTDAVFTPYPGFRSHVKVTRVVNTYGPQTRGGVGQGEAGELQRGRVTRDCGNSAIEERLQNIETHLKLPAAGPVPLSVYQRLKKLEDRILELEGLSPEYFQSSSYPHKRPKMSSAQACSLTELDGKISAVKAALLKRVNEFGPGYGTECPL